MNIKIGIFQMLVNASESMESRIKKVLDLDVDPSLDVLVLPELWLSGAFLEPSQFPPSFVDDFKVFSKKHNLVLVAGSVAFAVGEKYRNTIPVFDSGQFYESYSKIHLFGFDQGEKRFFSKGDSLKIIEKFGVSLGLSICYDLRFPEIFRRYRNLGTSIFIIPASWPISRIDHWETLLKARAIENQSLVIGCNAVGNQNEVTLGGRSMVIDPLGNALSLASFDSEEVLVVEFDLSEISKIRGSFPVHLDVLEGYENIDFTRT